MTTNATIDSKENHEIYKKKVDYPEYIERFYIFGNLSIFGPRR